MTGKRHNRPISRFESSASFPDSWNVLDEDKFGEEFRSEINQKIHHFIDEISNNSLFKPLLNLPTVKVDTSVNPKTPFCFRTSAEFQNISAQDAFALFVDVASRGLWDAMCHDIKVLKQLDQLTFVYHLQLKATWPTTARDSLSFAAFRKLSDGRFVSVAWSIEDDSLCPPDPSGKYIRINARISANLFTPITSTSFRFDQLVDGDPKGYIPSFIIKKVSAKSFPDTIEAIKQVISGRKPVSPDYYESLIESISRNK